MESNGPDVKIRGNAAHNAEKYQALYRDASVSGDRITAESYSQHAEHYVRIVQATQAQAQERQQAEQERRQRSEQKSAETQDANARPSEEPEVRAEPVVSEQPAEKPAKTDAPQPAMPEEAFDLLLTEKSPRDSETGNKEADDAPAAKADTATEEAPKKPRRRAPRRKPVADDKAVDGKSNEDAETASA
jgi:hypothetical protein